MEGRVRLSHWNGNFSLLLPEGESGSFSVIYGTVTQGNTSSTVGVQSGVGLFTQYACNNSGGPVTSGVQVNFQPACVRD